MRVGALALAAVLAWPLGACTASADSTADDRVAVSVDGASLTGTSGGGGASAAWLHNFDVASLASAAVEHQVLGNAHWTFGSLSGSVTRGPEDQRYSLYADAHEGAGDDGPHAFHYAIEAAGVYGTYFHQLSAQLEDKRVDVETTHGNLPKAGLSYLWGPHYLTSIAYSHSVSGNLGTRLTAVRIDKYGPAFNLLAGGAFGQAAPAIFNVEGRVVIPGRHLNEGYVGVVKPFSRLGEVTLVADYLDLAGSKRVQVTLNYIFRIGGAGSAR